MTGREEIIDNLKIICQCKGIKKGRFKKLIAEGVRSADGLRSATGAGSGSCGGKRCGPRIDALLAETAQERVDAPTK
ncbi:MAG: (2Fe-2S)-binding protein [Nitrospinae bacterium]|nr:(2Fe-2S)-binding protein [Nitrospinota bacterium]